MGTLKEAYPTAHCSLTHSNEFELLIATILSSQCTDRQVNLVTKKLFRLYPTPIKMMEEERVVIEEIIYPTGFFRSKAKNIQETCRQIVVRFGGKVPSTMEELVSLPGVGRKTANVVLGNWFGVASGVVVDTHVNRVTHRLGLSNARTVSRRERDLMLILKREDWTQFSHTVIAHGRSTCLARRPRCSECSLKRVCPSYRMFHVKHGRECEAI